MTRVSNNLGIFKKNVKTFHSSRSNNSRKHFTIILGAFGDGKKLRPFYILNSKFVPNDKVYPKTSYKRILQKD